MLQITAVDLVNGSAGNYKMLFQICMKAILVATVVCVCDCFEIQLQGPILKLAGLKGPPHIEIKEINQSY